MLIQQAILGAINSNDVQIDNLTNDSDEEFGKRKKLLLEVPM